MNSTNTEYVKTRTDEETKYIRLLAPEVIDNGYCALTSSISELENEKDYIIHFKLISHRASSIVVKFVDLEDTETTLGVIDLSKCEIIRLVNGKNEYYCILKFKASFTKRGKVAVGVELNNNYTPNEILIDIREIALQKGILLLPYAPGVEDNAKMIIEANTKIEQLADILALKASKTEIDDFGERLNSAEIKISPTKITDTVMDSSRFNTFTRDLDGFKFEITQKANVQNIVYNGALRGGYMHWSGHGTSGTGFWWDVYTNQTDYDLKGRNAIATKNTNSFPNEKSVWSAKCYRLEKNKDYTICFHYVAEKNIERVKAYAVFSNTEAGDYAKAIEILNKTGGSQSQTYDDIPHYFTFNSGEYEWIWLRFDNDGMKPGVNVNEFCWFYIADIAIYKGKTGPIPFVPHKDELYSNRVTIDRDNFKLVFEDDRYAQMGRKGLEQKVGNMLYPYHCLGWAKAVGVPAGNPGKVNVRLPDEFDHVAAESINWSVSQRGYYFSTTGAFFPYYVQVQGERLFRHTDGHWYVEIHGYSRIQNANNPNDVQNMPSGVNAMLTVNA